MEQTIAERPLSQGQRIGQLHMQHTGTVNSRGAHFEKDRSERWCLRNSSGGRGTISSDRFGGDFSRRDNIQVPVCLDNLRGNCARGASCKYQHSESDEYDRSRFYQNEQEKLGAVANLGNSQVYRENKDIDSTTRGSSRNYRSKSPCRRFQNGSCYRGASCPYLHPELSSCDRLPYGSIVEEQHVDGTVRDPGFSEGYRDDTIRMSQEGGEADKENTFRAMAFSGGSRSRSPCRNFLRGNCRFGTFCKRWHPVDAYVRSRHDMRTQIRQGITATSSNPDSGEGNRDITLRTSQEHDGTFMHNPLKTGAFSRDGRSRPPCQDFLSGKCYRGASCVNFHPVTMYDRRRYDFGSVQQHQGASATLKTPHVGNGSEASPFRVSLNHEECRNHETQPYRDMPDFLGRCKAWSTKVGVQLAGNRENMDVTSSSWSHERQRSLCANDLRGDKSSREVCLQFKRGRCSRGALCRYLHGYRENVDVTSSTWSHERQRSLCANDLRGDKRSREVCLQFTRGRCNRGALCRYLHGYHEYATSNWDEKLYTEGPGGSRILGVANQNANTMMAQGHADIKNSKMSSGESRHIERSQNGCVDKETQGVYFDDAIEPKFFDHKVDAPPMGVHTCELSAENITSFCSSADNREDISLRSRPFKRQRSRSRSPFAPEDDFQCRKLRRYDSRIDIRGGRCYNVARFQYSDRHSYRYDKPIYHVNSLQCTKGEATTVNPCSHESNAYKLVTPQRHDKVLCQGMQIDPCPSGSLSSNIVIGSTKHEAKSPGGALQLSHTEKNDKKVAAKSIAVASSEAEIATSQGFHLDQCPSGSLGSIFAIGHKKNEAESAVYALKPSVTDQNDEDVATCSIAAHSKECTAAISQVVLESDSRSSCEEQRASPAAIDLITLSKEENAELATNMGQECSERSAELMPVIKTYSRKKPAKNCARIVSCEVTMKEVINASKQGITTSSLIKTSLSNPNIISVSGAPVDKMTSASTNNDLENTPMHDHSVKQLKKKTIRNIKKKCEVKLLRSASCEETIRKEVTDALQQGMPITSLGETSWSNSNNVSVSGVPVGYMTMNTSKNNESENALLHDLTVKQQESKSLTNKIEKIVEPTLATTEDGTLLVGNTDCHSLQALQYPPKAVIPFPGRKLLVIDLNGILADIVLEYPHKYKPDTTVSAKGVFKRPFCDDFLQFCFERFEVGIWSSRTKKNVIKVVDFLMKDTQKKLLFCWDQTHCTPTGYQTLENREKPLVLKELKKLWDNKEGHLPWKKRLFNETNTILVDDSPYKALRNPPYTAIFPKPYTFKDVEDKSLGPGGDLRVYLERLSGAENVQKFIQENPFGQRAITKANLSWGFYAKIVGNYGRQQENGDTTHNLDSLYNLGGNHLPQS